MRYSLAILTTIINSTTIAAMVKAARAEAIRQQADIRVVIKTVGCLDMPVIAQALLMQPHIDGLVVLGAVAQGDTDHDEVVVETMTLTITQLAVQYRKSVGFGVIGPGAKRSQFKNRTAEYAKRAVQATVHNIKLLRSEFS
ncbi:MAG: 6,7-dimethyl-8-ribityllumazine synthase [Candidatus Kerfeldbacteria bacterium]|nr:6,7-dimethyl-8-ribityllumazine synthase [Candidatus Kerfeldbacteria bacterium]